MRCSILYWSAAAKAVSAVVISIFKEFFKPSGDVVDCDTVASPEALFVSCIKNLSIG